MPRSNRGLTVGLVLVSAIATFAAVTFYMGRAAEMAKRVFAEQQLEEALKAKTELEKEKTELTEAKSQLEAKKQELEGQVTSLTTQAQQLSNDLASEKRASAAARDELTAARRQADEAKGRLESERREKLAMADELARAKQDAKRIQDDLTQLRQAKEALERRVKEMMASGATSDTIVVTPPSAGAPAAPSAGGASEGSVLVVNREFNFIVVNLGSRDGIKAGQFLQVWRAGKPLGQVQVERVYENMSAANILPEAAKGEIKEGDQVRR